MSGSDATEPEQLQDRTSATPLRSNHRKPVLWAARIETTGGASDCIALDLSLGGAKLRLKSGLAKDQILTLVIDHLGSFRAKVIWRGTEGGVRTAGIQFIDPPELVARMLRRALPV